MQIVILAFLFARIFLAHAEILSLNSESFHAAVLSPNSTIWLVQFDVQEVQNGALLDVAKKLQSSYGVSSAIVDCSKNLKLCRQQNVNVPSHQLFVGPSHSNPYTKKYYRASVGLEVANPSGRDIEKFISKNYPGDFVSKVDSLDELIGSPHEIPCVILFTDKGAVSLLYKSIGYHFRERLSLFQSSTSSNIASALNITSTTLGVIDTTDTRIDEFPNMDKGLGDRKALIDWLETYAIPVTQSSTEPATGNIDDGSSANAALSHVRRTSEAEKLSSEASWIVGVYSNINDFENSALRKEWSDDGVLRAAYIVCTDYEIDVNDSPINALCRSESQKLPVIVVIPFGSSKRKLQISRFDSEDVFGARAR